MMEFQSIWVAYFDLFYITNSGICCLISKFDAGSLELSWCWPNYEMIQKIKAL